MSPAVWNLLKAVQCHWSGGAGQCLGEELSTHLSNIPP